MSTSKIAVLYGSETGNAQDFASILSHKLHRLHFPHTLSSLADYKKEDILKCRYLFVICSTTGQGELPRNVYENSKGNQKSTLWTLLKKKNLPNDFLIHINSAYLGLGDSSYPKFNYALRKLHNRIVKQLGAKEIFDRLEADEQAMAGSNKGTGSGIESVYFEFERRVLDFLMNKFPNRKVNGQTMKREEIEKDIYLEPLTYLELDQNNTSQSDGKTSFSGDDSTRIGVVTENKRLTAEDHFQDVRQFIFKADEGKCYEPGDTIAIYPCNTDMAVQQMLDSQPHWLEIADKPLKFTNGAPPQLLDGGLVSPLTLRNLLKYHCDFMSIPRTTFFLKVWTFATDVSRLERGVEQMKDQQEKLYEFATDQDMQELYDYCNRPRRSIMEVIEDFQSLHLPWKYLLDYMPTIKPRFYSISSSANNPDIELTVAIVKYKTILRKIRTGVCTNFIGRLKQGDEVRFKLHNNNLLRKEHRGLPLILVGPGVGLAPLLSVVRSKLSEDMSLFFGCRFKDKDYLYEEELESLAQRGVMKLHPVFSRDRENSPDTKYVQDVLWKLGDEVTKKIIDDKAIFFLCGASGKMPIQIRLTFLEMLKKWGGFKDDESASEYLRTMEKEDRYLQETW
ncbi:NADPH-dependent diflavin oxidoreductase 1 [Nakaseomyces bracarensis]|uniref:NADPH-dependent diflavin oxidoreductase 1 n=1 Tax=Nakaseomyces bracarensis TaxID=273131 RepID=A0ABR4P0Q5_9SACH